MGVSVFTPVFLGLGMFTVPGPSIGVGPTEARGEGATPELVQKIDAGVIDALREGGYDVSAIGLGCSDAACVVDSARAGSLAGALTVRVEEDLNDYVISVDLRSAQDGVVLSTESRDCEICSFDEVTQAALELAQAVAARGGELAIAAEEAASVSFEGRLSVQSEPAGAEVFVDGESFGLTPFDGDVGVGTREIEIRKDGFATTRQTVEVTTKEARAISVALEAAADAGWWNAKTSRIVTWSALGAGGAALLSGFVLLGIDENPYGKDCKGANLDADGVCKFRYNTLGAGVGLTVSGLALVAAGTTLLVLDRKKEQRMSAVVGPRFIGLTGRF